MGTGWLRALPAGIFHEIFCCSCFSYSFASVIIYGRLSYYGWMMDLEKLHLGIGIDLGLLEGGFGMYDGDETF